MQEVKRKYTNCFVEMNKGKVVCTMKMKFKVPVTYDEAKAEAAKEVAQRPYLKYVGILNMDITSSKLNKMLSE